MSWKRPRLAVDRVVGQVFDSLERFLALPYFHDGVDFGPSQDDTLAGDVRVEGPRGRFRYLGSAHTFQALQGSSYTAITASAFTVSSSGELKRDVVDAPEALPSVLALRPVLYRRMDDSADAPMRYGLIAEEVAEVVPEAVRLGEHGEIVGIDYAQITALLLKAVQELGDEVAI